MCCNSVCPGFVATRLNAAVAADPERLARRWRRGRWRVATAQPADFAGVAVFLASRASDYVTGQTLYVDGGFSVTLRLACLARAGPAARQNVRYGSSTARRYHHPS